MNANQNKRIKLTDTINLSSNNFNSIPESIFTLTNLT